MEITIAPQGAIDSGAQWQVDGGAWNESGVTISSLSVGNHNVYFKSRFGYITPSSKTVSIYRNETTELTSSYQKIDGSTLYVPLNYITIQAAIEAASDGDTVLVADGTYYGTGNKDLDFAGKAIKVTSENGAEKCIIDCERDGRGFYFHTGEKESSVITGFSVINGIAENGGGIYCSSSSPTITNCIITGNGSGSSVLDDYGGGGIYCIDSSPVITNCTIVGNSTGGLYPGCGGGIYCTNSFPIIANCTISENSGDSGGGICSINSTLSITNCIITNNSSASSWSVAAGGGILFSSSSSATTATIVNCTITGNSARGRYGASSGFGGGIACSSTSIVNSILYGNTPDEISVSSNPIVTYSDIQGGYSGIGNIDADPLFVGNGDYHLTALSPCIDLGTSEGAPSTDIGGTPRPQGAGYDMGAYEYVQSTPPPPVFKLVPCYRFFSRYYTTYLYTASEEGKEAILAHPEWTYSYEGIAYYVYVKDESE